MEQVKSKGMRKLISVFLMCYGLVSMAQVGIGVEDPKAAIHIGQGIKLKDVHNVEGEMTKYPRHLIADERGNLGVFTGLPTDLVFNNVITKTMTNIVEISKKDLEGDNIYAYTEKSLQLNTTVTVPAGKTYVMEVTYSIPSMYPQMDNPKGEFGVLAKKKEGNANWQVIDKSIRKFSTTHRTAPTASANGRAIGYVYIDKVINNTDSPLEVVYDLYGFTNYINLSNYKIKFGSFSTNNINYNWGRGLLLVTINEQIQ